MTLKPFNKSTQKRFLRKWENVTELAADIVNADAKNDAKAALSAKRKLLSYLKGLQKSFGVHPSIVATRADYEKKPKRRVELYKRAFQLAQDIGDARNQTLVSSSLAQIYTEELRNSREATTWLKVLKEALKHYPDDCERGEWRRLSREVKRMARGK